MGYCTGRRPHQWIQEHEGNLSPRQPRVQQPLHCSHPLGSQAPDHWYLNFQTGQIDELVNNESSEIIRIFNSAFDEFLDEKHAKRDFYPEPVRGEIDEINEWVYDNFNNGVYKVAIFKVR